MQKLTIKINSIEDAKAGKKIVETATKENTVECVNLTAGILEGGMESGKTSIMFILEMPDGTHAVAQLTQDLLDGLNGAVRGAVERFGK